MFKKPPHVRVFNIPQTRGTMKGQAIVKEGVVEEALPSTLFRVRFEDDTVIIAHLAGRLRVNYIRVMPGDRVRVELSEYDLTKGRIVHRLK